MEVGLECVLMWWKASIIRDGGEIFWGELVGFCVDLGGLEELGDFLVG